MPRSLVGYANFLALLLVGMLAIATAPLPRYVPRGRPLSLGQPPPLARALARYEPRPLGDEASRAARSSNDLGMALLRTLPKDENAVLSPLSIATSMAMLYPGANAATRAELSSSLGYERHGLVHVARGFGSLRNQTAQGKGYRLVEGSALFQHSEYKIDKEYARAIRDDIGAQIVTTDFEDIERTRQTINELVRETSQGLIWPALNEPLHPDTRLVLINAVYFKGFWEKPFSVSSTFMGTFMNHGTDPQPVRIMYMRESFFIKPLPAIDANAILLPYEGNGAAMLVVLPKLPTGVDALLNTLSVTDLVSSLHTFTNVSLDLFLPKMELEASYKLKDELSSVGVSRVFRKGELTGIGSTLQLSDVLHRAKVNVDERGTEAVALTALPVISYSAYPNFYVSHPFLFFIIHRSSGTVLFAGKVVQLP
ncbi:intracellular coagulation inhibitor 1-like [Ornithodoros turicata]|uniref:intracellular coagulation inhibitor 1-like n=1 Tax=Ornithodoros turicata TaxID=34597 RepID=UPI00313913F4